MGKSRSHFTTPEHETNAIDHFGICHSYLPVASGPLGKVPAEHPGIELTEFLSPNSLVEFRGKTFVAPMSQIFVLNALEQHSDVYEGNGTWLSRAIVIDGHFCNDFFEEIGIDANTLAINGEFFNLDLTFRALIDQLFFWRSIGRPLRATIDCLSSEILSLVLERVPHNFKAKLKFERVDSYYRAPILLSRKLIRERFLDSDELELGEIAKTVGISKFHFVREFKKWTGESPRQYIRQLRIDAAKKMLLNGHSVTDTAFASGFGDLSEHSKSTPARRR